MAIARALIKHPVVLLLDEATSALDNETEKLIINSIASSSSKLTIIMIAHRLSSLSLCNRIIEINSGKVLREITVDQLNS